MKTNEMKPPNHSHAWRGAWNRPMHVDENELHPFTVARMTDHNVRGLDERDTFKDDSNHYADPRRPKEKLDRWETEGGYLKDSGGL